MKNVKQIFLNATTAGVLAFAAVGGVAQAQSYVPPEDVPPEYVPPTVPPETGTGTTNTNTNTNTNTATANASSDASSSSNSSSNATGGNATATGGNANANGGAGGNGYGGNGGSGGSVGDVINSFRSYAYAGGPAIGAAVDRCLAVVGTSGHIGVAGVNLGLGGTRATYSEQCAADLRALNGETILVGFLATVKDPTRQAFAAQVLAEKFPEYAAAITVVGTGYAVAQQRCGKDGVNNMFDILSTTCTPAAVQVKTEVVVVDRAPQSTAAPRRRVTPAHRAAATPARTTTVQSTGKDAKGCRTYNVTVCPVTAPAPKK